MEVNPSRSNLVRAFWTGGKGNFANLKKLYKKIIQALESITPREKSFLRRHVIKDLKHELEG